MAFLVASCLVGGWAHAQTPQIKLVWEKTIPDGVLSVALDEPDSLSPPVVTVVTAGKLPQWKYKNTQQVLKINGTGTMQEILTKRYWDPLVISSNGRFIGFYFWKGFRRPGTDTFYTKLSSAYVVTPAQKHITLQGKYANCDIAAISNNGKVILGAEGLGYPIELGQISTKNETFVVFNGQGKQVCEIPSYGEEGKKMSADGSYIAIGQLHRSNPFSRTLRLYDKSGKLLWEKSIGIGFTQHFDVTENGTVAEGYFRLSDSICGVSAYNRTGAVIGDVPLGMKIAIDDVILDSEGRYALIKGFWYKQQTQYQYPYGQSLFLLRINPPSILWRLDTPAWTHDTSVSFDCLQIAKNGRFVVALVTDYKKKNYYVLYDQDGKVEWRKETRIWGMYGSALLSPSNRYLLLKDDSLWLYRIE